MLQLVDKLVHYYFSPLRPAHIVRSLLAKLLVILRANLLALATLGGATQIGGHGKKSAKRNIGLGKIAMHHRRHFRGKLRQCKIGFIE